MTARTRLILAIVGVVVVLALFFFLFIRSRQGELNEVRALIEAEENISIQLTTELNRLEDLQRRAPELQAELADIRDLVPLEHQVPNFIFLVQDAATEAGVSFLQITPELPKTPPEQAPLAEVRMTIQAEGGFFSIQDFIRRLHDLDRALRIDLLAMAGEEDGTPVSITLDLTSRIFFELPAVPESGEAVPNVPGAPAPGATPAPPVESPAPEGTP